MTCNHTMIYTCPCCRGAEGEGTLSGFLRGVLWLLKLTGVTLVGASLFVAGRAFTPRARRRRKASGATWLHGGVRQTPRRGLHWYAWPGWQRSIVRTLLVALAVAEYLSPVATGLGLAAATLATASAALFARVRQRVATQRALRQRDTTATLPPVRVAAITTDQRPRVRP